jgi:hypothetical protein
LAKAARGGLNRGRIGLQDPGCRFGGHQALVLAASL